MDTHRLPTRRPLRALIVATLVALATLAGLVPAGAPAGAAPPGTVNILSALGYDQPGPNGIHRIDWALAANDGGKAVDTVEVQRWNQQKNVLLATYTQDANEYEPTRIVGPFGDGVVFQYRARAHNPDGWSGWGEFEPARVEVGFNLLRPFATASQFVERQVSDFEAGLTIGQLNYWKANVGDTGKVTDFIDHLAGRYERRNRAAVIRLYLAYFDRAPEPGGLDYWQDRLDAKTATLTSVSNFFAKSGEYTATYGNTTNSQFVTLVYQNVLDRDPEPAGLAYWKGRLDQGTTTRGTLMIGFSESAEGKALKNGETVVADVWAAVMDEQPSTANLDAYAGHIDAGGTAGDIAVMLLPLGSYPSF